MAAVIAIATILAAGLVVFPGSIQEAQANPCSVNQDGDAADTITTGDQDCDLTGYFEFDEDGTSDSGLAATAGNNIIDDPLFNLADVFDESD